MMTLTLDDRPTCPCEDPTSGTRTAAGVVYTTLVDQHVVPSEGIEDRIPDLPPWDNFPPVRHLG
jgi:hypothetical protein